MNEHIETARYHRLSRKKNQNRPCSKISRITKFKEKTKNIEKAKLLKNTGISISEDFLKDTREMRKGLWQKVLECWSIEGRINLLIQISGRDSAR